MNNDFIKEELESILEGISWWLDGDSALYCEKLIDKIQNMIDNYCEHDLAGPIYNIVESNVRRPDIKMKICKNCGKLVEI